MQVKEEPVEVEDAAAVRARVRGRRARELLRRAARLRAARRGTRGAQPPRAPGAARCGRAASRAGRLRRTTRASSYERPASCTPGCGSTATKPTGCAPQRATAPWPEQSVGASEARLRELFEQADLDLDELQVINRLAHH